MTKIKSACSVVAVDCFLGWLWDVRLTEQEYQGGCRNMLSAAMRARHAPEDSDTDTCPSFGNNKFHSLSLSAAANCKNIWRALFLICIAQWLCLLKEFGKTVLVSFASQQMNDTQSFQMQWFFSMSLIDTKIMAGLWSQQFSCTACLKLGLRLIYSTRLPYSGCSELEQNLSAWTKEKLEGYHWSI